MSPSLDEFDLAVPQSREQDKHEIARVAQLVRILIEIPPFGTNDVTLVLKLRLKVRIVVSFSCLLIFLKMLLERSCIINTPINLSYRLIYKINAFVLTLVLWNCLKT